MTNDEVLEKVGNYPEFSECSKCGYFMEDIDAHCKGCGRVNPKFNEVAFEHKWGGTHFQIRTRECMPEHNVFLPYSPDAIGPFCELCGYGWFQTRNFLN